MHYMKEKLYITMQIKLVKENHKTNTHTLTHTHIHTHEYGIIRINNKYYAKKNDVIIWFFI